MVKMKTNNNKKKINGKGILVVLILFGTAFLLGYGMGEIFGKNEPDADFFSEVMGILVLVLVMWYVAMFVHIILHEAGHLIFGLLTGYRFISFRLGSFMWLKEKGKVKVKRFSIPGTGGQCLMAPPESESDKMPVLLYNLGGGLFNLLASFSGLMLACAFRDKKYILLGAILFAVVGIVLAAINLIPFCIAAMPNDGYNVKLMYRNPEARRAFWIQLKINEQNSYGKRMKEMPEEWFQLLEDEALKDSMMVTLAVFRCSWLQDKGLYKEADELMETLLKKKTGMLEIHRRILINEQIYCEIVGEKREERIKRLLSEEQKKFMKSMKAVPSIHRTAYLYELYITKDEKKAAVSKTAFEKLAARYPYAHEIVSEREMITYAHEKLADKNNCNFE